LPIAALGLLTIVTNGVAFYAYGVLIAPIAVETGWPQAGLGAIFSGVLLITGIGGVVAGGLLDRFGEQPLFAVAAALGAGSLLLAASRAQLLAFALSYSVGCGLIGALGFYHITQTAAPCGGALAGSGAVRSRDRGGRLRRRAVAGWGPPRPAGGRATRDRLACAATRASRPPHAALARGGAHRRRRGLLRPDGMASDVLRQGARSCTAESLYGGGVTRVTSPP